MSLLLALAAALLALLIAGLVAGVGRETALPHPGFTPMQRGIDGGTLGAPTWTGYATGLCIIGMMWVAIQVGFPGRRWMQLVVDLWTLWYVLAFVALMRTYAAYEGGRTTIAAGFPVPSAWLVYGIGLSPWILLLLITYRFRRVYFGPDEQARFDRILSGETEASESAG